MLFFSALTSDNFSVSPHIFIWNSSPVTPLIYTHIPDAYIHMCISYILRVHLLEMHRSSLISQAWKTAHIPTSTHTFPHTCFFGDFHCTSFLLKTRVSCRIQPLRYVAVALLFPPCNTLPPSHPSAPVFSTPWKVLDFFISQD